MIFNRASVFSQFKAKRLAKKTHIEIIRAYRASGQEAQETREMAQSFFKLLESKLDLRNRKEPPSKEEIKTAIDQLKDVGRFSILITLFILPGGSVSIIAMEYLAKRMGVQEFTFFPSAFHYKKKK